MRHIDPTEDAALRRGTPVRRPGSLSGQAPEPVVAVVVVNWNGWRDTLACLRSLAALEPGCAHTIVVDNGSTDDSVERIAAEFPGVDVVRSADNLGFAGGANLGIRRALKLGVDFVWLLNNDATVEPDTLRALLAEADDRRVGIVGGVLVDPEEPDRVLAWGGGFVGPLGTTTALDGPGRLPDYVEGSSMLVRTALLERVGLFDEAFFFYYEDADLCRRAREAGWRIAVAPGARVAHAVGASVSRDESGRSERSDELQAESGGVYLGKYAGPLLIPALVLRSLGILVHRLAQAQFTRGPRLVRALVRGARRRRATRSADPAA